MSTSPLIPEPLEHLPVLFQCHAYEMQKAHTRYEPDTPTWRIISLSMHILYLAATCHRKCHGGPHILEALAGRCYNLASATCALLRICQYDEALSQIRSLGEIHNLLLLFIREPERIQVWINADRRTRMRAFGPAAVRELLNDIDLPQVKGDWYSDLCERAVHIHPGTRPNKHSSDITAFIGPYYQEDGEDEVVGELMQLTATISMGICRWFKFDDLMGEMKRLIDEAKS